MNFLTRKSGWSEATKFLAPAPSPFLPVTSGLTGGGVVCSIQHTLFGNNSTQWLSRKRTGTQMCLARRGFPWCRLYNQKILNILFNSCQVYLIPHNISHNITITQLQFKTSSISLKSSKFSCQTAVFVLYSYIWLKRPKMAQHTSREAQNGSKRHKRGIFCRICGIASWISFLPVYSA